MDIKNIAILGTLAFGLFACGGNENAENTSASTETTEESTEVAESTTYTVDNSASTVAWSGGTAGAKVYGHNGVIDITEGSLEMKGDKVVNGSITIDMTTIQPLDSSYAPEGSEEGTKAHLIGHLSSADFFMVDSFPTAKFVIKSMEGNSITGDLTIRGNTNEETVTDVMVESTDSGVKASGKLVFDRQKYDVAWKHFMQDVILSDDIELNIELVANK